MRGSREGMMTWKDLEEVEGGENGKAKDTCRVTRAGRF